MTGCRANLPCEQYEDKDTKSLMMLPSDMALVQDKKFKAYVQKYAADNDLWFKDFSDVMVKLFELGVPFARGPRTRNGSSRLSTRET